MKKIILYTLLLFWWCLLFPFDSCFEEPLDADISSNPTAIVLHGKEIRLGLFHFESSS